MAREEVERLPTKAVLGRLARLRRSEESREASDASAEELTRVVGIRFKRSPEWRAAVDEAKAVLATHANVLSGPKRTAARKERGKHERLR
jgi:hypothetical protein